MKTTLLFTVGISSVLLLSCAQEEKKIISIEKNVSYTKMKPVHADRKLAIEVSGMTCEHACGGSIRMALKETGAVDRVSYDFEADRKVNTAYITFDKSKISVDRIIGIIESINEKQFTTGKSSSSAVETSVTSVESSAPATTKTTEKTTVTMKAPEIEVPSLRSFFGSLLK